MKVEAGLKPFIRKAADVQPVPCPCGQATRIVTGADGGAVSIHRVAISGEAKLHRHARLTEYYVVLNGTGEIQLGEELHAVGVGDVICIPPGTPHALRGEFEIINVVSPPFDSDDEEILE